MRGGVVDGLFDDPADGLLVVREPGIVERMLVDLTALPGAVGAPKLRPALTAA